MGGLSGNRGMRFALQNARLLNHARKVRDRLFIDGRWLRLSRLLDLRQIAAGQVWLPVSQREDSLQGPALARPAHPWVRFPEVLTPLRSCRPKAWSP